MNHLKTVLRVGGIVVAAIGAIFLPKSVNVFRKGHLSVFHNIADLGVFVPIALILVAVGLIAIGASFLVRSGETS